MKILLVDDEPNVLNALNRQLRLRYEVDTAGSGAEALKKIRAAGPYAVVVSDLSMPGMDGIELLREVAKIHNSTVRIILTGNADQQSAIDAINKGEAFRFLTKPCFGFALQNEIDAGVELYRLRVSEKELLEKTLAGSIGILTEMLAIVNPQAFGRTQFIKKIVMQLADTLNLKRTWQYKVAAMLSMIGFITVPQDTLEKYYNGEELSRDEDKIIEEHNKIAVRLVSKIPRLSGIAKMLSYLSETPDQALFTKDIKQIDPLILGGYLIRIAMDFDMYIQQNLSVEKAMRKISGNANRYHPKILEALSRIKLNSGTHIRKYVDLNRLEPGMIFEEDVYTDNNKLVITAGQSISPTTISRLRSIKEIHGLKGPFLVKIDK